MKNTLTMHASEFWRWKGRFFFFIRRTREKRGTLAIVKFVACNFLLEMDNQLFVSDFFWRSFFNIYHMYTCKVRISSRTLPRIFLFARLIIRSLKMWMLKCIILHGLFFFIKIISSQRILFITFDSINCSKNRETSGSEKFKSYRSESRVRNKKYRKFFLLKTAFGLKWKFYFNATIL